MQQILKEVGKLHALPSLPSTGLKGKVESSIHIFEYDISDKIIRMRISLKVHDKIRFPLLELKENPGNIMKLHYHNSLLDCRDTFRASVALANSSKIEALQMFCLEAFQHFDC